MAFVKFKRDVGSWKQGSVYELEDDIARAFGEGDNPRVVAVPAEEFISATRASKDEELRRSILSDVGKSIEEALRNFKPQGYTPQPPTGGGGVNFDDIAGGTTPADEVRDLSIQDALRCMFYCQATGIAPEMAEFGRQRLRHYTAEVRRYEANPNTGQVRVVIERTIGRDGKGLEVITRDGTDSLSGGGGYGFTLQPNYVNSLYTIAVGQQVFAPSCEMVPMGQGNETRWPALGQFSAPKVVNGIPMPASLGGVQVFFKSETAPRVATDASTRMIDFKAEDCTALTKFSRDYILDASIQMSGVIARRIGMAIGIVKDWTTIFGSGIGMPEGFTNSKAFIQRTRGSAGHIQYEDVVYMMSRMAAGCLTTARWLTNQTTMPELMAIKDAAGNRVFLPNSLITQADLPSFIAKTTGDPNNITRLMGTLQGLPVWFSEYVPALGQANDLMLVCPSQYGLAQRQGLEVMVSDQVYFETDEIGYKFKERFDGKSLWPSPYIQADNLSAPGSGTQVSPFIGITVS